jgi:hypothetical protein
MRNINFYTNVSLDSGQTALIRNIDDWITAIYENEIVDSMFLDPFKALSPNSVYDFCVNETIYVMYI